MINNRMYHGTSLKNLDLILAKGLTPRGRRKGHWETSSHPKAVYLSNAYAPYYACQAMIKDDHGAVVFEVDMTKIIEWRLHPDEDFLEQVSRNDPKALLHGESMRKRTLAYRDKLHEYQPYWEQSIEYLGNCCVMGRIPVSALTRYVIIPKKHRAFLDWDPTITVMNYHVMGDHYRRKTQKLFGDEPGKPIGVDLWPIVDYDLPVVPLAYEGVHP